MFYNLKKLIPAKKIHTGNFIIKNNFRINNVNDIYNRGSIPKNVESMPLVCYSLIRENEMFKNKINNLKDSSVINYLNEKIKNNQDEIEKINKKFLFLIENKNEFDNYHLQFCCNTLYINSEKLDNNLYTILLNKILSNLDYLSLNNLIDVAFVLKKSKKNDKNYDIVLKKIKEKLEDKYEDVSYNGSSIDQYSNLDIKENNLDNLLSSNPSLNKIKLFYLMHEIKKSLPKIIFRNFYDLGDYIEPVTDSEELLRLKELGFN